MAVSGRKLGHRCAAGGAHIPVCPAAHLSSDDHGQRRTDPSLGRADLGRLGRTNSANSSDACHTTSWWRSTKDCDSSSSPIDIGSGWGWGSEASNGRVLPSALPHVAHALRRARGSRWVHRADRDWTPPLSAAVRTARRHIRGSRLIVGCPAHRRLVHPGDGTLAFAPSSFRITMRVCGGSSFGSKARRD